MDRATAKAMGFEEQDDGTFIKNGKHFIIENGRLRDYKPPEEEEEEQLLTNEPRPEKTAEPVKGELVPVGPMQNTGIVAPQCTPDEAVQAFKLFQDIKKKLIDKDDIQTITDKRGNKSGFIKKSGWRKIATAFNLTDEIIRHWKEEDGDGYTWRVEVRVTAPNGRSTIAIGSCSTKERNFAHEEHDVFATAHTRAKNRGISDLVGGGQASAEEYERSN